MSIRQIQMRGYGPAIAVEILWNGESKGKGLERKARSRKNEKDCQRRGRFFREGP